ncbi:hypothetical protein [Rouxiella sp. WC2420]|uniref:Uncharacterized protein n=1 Tax=Rouxiella sp. WC2420 TaxID=3234145 RepID=A0AB39VY01_9GAMM
MKSYLFKLSLLSTAVILSPQSLAAINLPDKEREIDNDEQVITNEHANENAAGSSNPWWPRNGNLAMV